MATGRRPRTQDTAMAQGSFFARCFYLLSEMASYDPLRPYAVERATQEVLASRDAQYRRFERIEALERSDRLDRWGRELVRDHHAP